MTRVNAEHGGDIADVTTLAWNLDAASRHPFEMLPPHDVRTLIGNSRDLPPLPQITRRLLDLQRSPEATAKQLADIVELDPLLTGQLLRWANSAYYAVRQQVVTVQDAIVRVLGFETALSLALGLTALVPLRTPNHGALGRDAVWQHGMLCSALMQRLRLLLPPDPPRPSVGLTQTAGLTHNVGYLILGHLLTDAFEFVSQLIQQNPVLELPVMERFALGVDHTQLGLWLFDEWQMPAALRCVVREHHNVGYQGEHEQLVLLTWLADHLLAHTSAGLGPPRSPECVEIACTRLGVDYTATQASCAFVMERVSGELP
ncbi:HDOD domain-containing protein [Rhodopseudomonas palustris]|uniref:HDOD domain-containing protein n=2 Tax=Thiospirillum jenense TaxID=1653858 RepID=A0A839HHK1_9GAMM|nr:HDOD domain-containing protein [Rhodopseudomonas palustris]MBB1126289.1 HDOD domain-containing protein [Thiospirillum jenense]